MRNSNDFVLKEYTQEEYTRDMQKLLQDKGLKGAVEQYLDEIVAETSGLPYIPNMTVKEFACDILFLIDLYTSKGEQK